MNEIKTYRFEIVKHCEMCGSDTDNHKILGLRLNQSVGLNPQQKEGIAVSVKKCKDCGLIYSSPLPTPENLQDHYGIPPEDYWEPFYFEWSPDYFAGEIATAKKLLEFKPGMKALDVGAGIGKCMLSLNNAGFDTFGFEPSVPFYKRALSKMNIDKERLKLGKIEEIEYENDFFDFISFGAVLEHLSHPAKCLEKAIKWLKPGGVIQIEVPSADYFIPKLINFYFGLKGTNYVTHISPMHEPFHMYEFGLKSFEKISKKLNVQLVFHKYFVGNMDFLPKLIRPFLNTYMQKTNKGMQLTVWLKK